MSKQYIKVGNSKIHGKGLFAKAPIKKHEVLGFLKTRPSKKDGPHVLWCNDGKEGHEVICDFRFINHSTNPNVAYYDDLSVVALRNIEPGEELTHHYGEDWVDEA
jgi:SET domain-containing protein